jgi:hypothetical protein
MAKAASTNSAVQWLGWADGVVFVYDCHSAYSFDMIPRYRDGAISRSLFRFPLFSRR